MFTLKVEKRAKLGKASQKLGSDVMPAVYYGHKEASTPIAVSKSAFKKLWKNAGESSVVVLTDGEREIESLIHEVDFDPIKGEPRHADFYVLEKGKKVRVPVAIHFEGVSPAVKDLGGVLVKVLHEIEIEADPRNLPHHIVVDISLLTTFESQILVKDVVFPNGVSPIAKDEEVVAAISKPHEEKVDEVPVDLSAIEVEKKGKKEEEGEAGASGEEKKSE